MHDDGRVEAFVQSTLRAADCVNKIATQSSATAYVTAHWRPLLLRPAGGSVGGSATTNVPHPAVATNVTQAPTPTAASDEKEPAAAGPDLIGTLQSGERASWRDPGYFGLYYSTFLVGVFSSTGPLMYPIFTQLLQMPSYRVKAVMQVLLSYHLRLPAIDLIDFQSNWPCRLNHLSIFFFSYVRRW